jgi:PiT family inorganic phosphate transporter
VAVAADIPEELPPVGTEEPEHVRSAHEVVGPSAVVRVVAFRIIGPSVATLLSDATVLALPIPGTTRPGGRVGPTRACR